MQHEILVEQFESYLAGKASQEFLNHLAVCSACRTEISAMENIAEALRSAFDGTLRNPALEASDAIQPSLGFYNRVASRIIREQRSEAWGLFSPGVAFFRRVAFASLLLLAGLGTFLVTKENSDAGADAAYIMAQHDASSVHSESSDRDRLLVTLATYRQ
jgi:anti-sigma factor RsiW